MKKINIPNEIAYVIAIILLSFAVAMSTMTGFGVSMIAAPTLILNMKFNFLTYGQWEYVFQGGLFIIMCIVLRKFKISYLTSFMCTLIYGFALDLWRLLPIFNPNLVSAEDYPIFVRILFLIGGITITSFSIALFLKTYLYPQVPDLFARAVATTYKLKYKICKYVLDITYLLSSIVLSLVFFHDIEGIGWATILIVIVNSPLISAFSKLLDKCFTFNPLIKNIASYFDL